MSLNACIDVGNADMNNLKNELQRILDNRLLSAVYQPIVNLRMRNIYGYESLIRGPSNSPLHSPVTLFDIAEHSNSLFKLEMLAREISSTTFSELNLPGKIFINVCPAVLLQPEYEPGVTIDFLKKLGINPENVVIELTEQYPLEDYEILRTAVYHYRSMGFEIAIDDLGAGYSGLRMWSELRPDYVKIDKHFIQGINEDKVKQEFVQSIIEIAKSLDCHVIAEGIETSEEFKIVCGMGINFGQGYYFARPHPKPDSFLPESLFICNHYDVKESKLVRMSETVVTLLRESPSVPLDCKLSYVIDLLLQNRRLSTISVLDKKSRPVGLLRRKVIMDMFVNPYGRSLYGDKPVRNFMEDNPIVIEQQLSVEKASKLITQSMQLEVEDDFIIVHKGQYQGIGKVVDLLKKITDLQIRNARYANPLTMLPGNVPIYEQIDKLLGEHLEFTIAYCDLDNFKPFNDVYGYNKGDQVLKKVAEIFMLHCTPDNDFIGHVGGDDFILIFTSADWEARCNKILQQFELEIPQFYKLEDMKNGGITAIDRNGQSMFYPMLSLSIGAVSPEPKYCTSHHDVATLATDAKKNAKAQPGNFIFIDRRKKTYPLSPS